MLRSGIGEGWSLAGLRSCAGLYHWLARVKVGGFLLLFAALMVYGLEMPYKITDDGGAYILLAQALITGEGYHNIWWAGSPPHTSYPPVHPLLLAPIISLYGVELWALRLWISGLGILALYAVYRLFRRVAGDRSAFALSVLTGTSYGIWFYAQSPLSEIPYALFSFLGLCFLEEYKRAPNPLGGWLWLAALTIGTAALTRTIGLALLIGGVAYLAFEGSNGVESSAKERLTKSALLAVIGGIPVLLWFLRALIVADGAHGPIYFQQYGLKDYTSVDSRILGLRDLYELVYHNLYVYTRAAAETVLPDFIGPPGTIVAILVTAMIGMGFLICVRMRRTGLEYYGLAYACALLPYPAPYPRYLVPIIPLLWYYALVSLWHSVRLLPLGRRMHRRPTTGGPVVWVVVTVLTGINLVSAVDNTLLNPAKETAYRIDQEEARYVDSLPWVEEHTAADSVFMWAKSSLRYLVVQRRAAMLPTTADRQEVIETINEAQVDYVAIDAFSDSSLRYLKPVIDEHPEKFSLVYEDQTTRIYQVVR